MFARLFSSRKAVHLTLCASLASAVVPATLCLFELSGIREEVATIERSTAEAKLARDLVDKVGQSLFNLTLATLDLSEEERKAAFEQAGQHLRSLSQSVTAAHGLTRALLPAAEQSRLDASVSSLVHSWEEIRDRPVDELTAPEKAFHFLKILDDAQLARTILIGLEASAAGAADKASLSSLRHVNDIGTLLLFALGLGACVSTAALVGNFRYAAATRKVNGDLQRAVDELERRDEALRRSNERFHTALENMSQGLCMFDRDQRLIVCNARYGEIYGLPAALTQPGTALGQILAHRAANGVSPEGASLDYAQERLAQIVQGKPFNGVVTLKDGRVLLTVHRPMSNGGFLGTHEDITERKKAEAQIVHMAHHDALTNLPNRVLFRQDLVKSLARVRRRGELSVLCLDLDHFKDVNDTLGHPIGDALLRAVADRLRGCVRETDTVARLGGDEFAVVQVGVERADDPSLLSQRIIATLSAPYEVEGHHVVIGASVGIALAPNDGDDPDQLLKAADMALYRAKTDGRGTYRFFETDMDAKMQARRALELDLRKALANEEFELHYQPLVNLEHNRVSGFEALLRWNQPGRGRVPPADFIPLAEEIGLIGQIGAWVLKRSCADAAGWPDDVRLAVNLSPHQFKSRSLVLDVISALGSSGLAARRLELEITETVMLQDTDTTLSILHQLRELGVRISMDDFGTGYSSLSYLRKFPFDKIKIDQSFIRDLPEQADSVAIVRAVAGLSTSLGMSTTAEGVETEEQLAKLRSEGCTEVQGYLFSPPRPAGDIASMLSITTGRDRAAA